MLGEFSDIWEKERESLDGEFGAIVEPVPEVFKRESFMKLEDELLELEFIDGELYVAGPEELLERNEETLF